MKIDTMIVYILTVSCNTTYNNFNLINFGEQKAYTCCLIDLQWVSTLLRLMFSISWTKKIRNQNVSNPTESTFSKYIEVPEHDQVTLMGFMNHVTPPPVTTHKRNHRPREVRSDRRCSSSAVVFYRSSIFENSEFR